MKRQLNPKIKMDHKHMLEKHSLTDQRIIECLYTYYGIEIVKLTFLPIGADMNASVYKADTRDQSSYFVKLKRGSNHDISIDIIELLHHAGIQQIIPPIKTISDQSIQRINDFTLIVYPFIEGQNGFTQSLTNKQWQMLGETMKKIHNIDVPVSIQHQLRRETYSPRWREIVRSFYQQIDEEPTGDEIAQKLLAFIKQNKVTIRRLVDCADKLAQKLQNDSSKFVLCHSDIHGGNVLLNGDAFYIVDWDEPMMAPKERDLMFIGGGVGNVWNNPHEEALFYESYGKTDINTTILTYYRHERIVQDIAEYAQQLLLTTTGGGADRRVMFKHFMDMFELRGVVEIAFETGGMGVM